MGEKKTKKKRVKQSDIDLKDVIELGGSKDDFELVNDIEDSGSEIDNLEDDRDADPVKKDDVQELLQQLEIYKYRPSTKDPDEEKLIAKRKEKKELRLAKLAEKDEEPKPEKETKSVKVSKEIKKDSTKKIAKTSKKEDKSETTPGTEVTPAPEVTPKPSAKSKKNKYKVQHDEISSTTGSGKSAADVKRDTTPELYAHIRGYKPRKYLLVKMGGDFFDEQEAPDVAETTSQKLLKQMEEFAGKLLGDEIMMYNKQKENAKRSDVAWMKTVLTSGTLADKMAALTVLVQESPLHSLTHLDSMVAMTVRKGKREALQAADTLKDLFLSELIPEDRKLKSFSQQPFSALIAASSGNKDTIDRRLLHWYFEARLKEKYESYVKALEVLGHDTIPATKQKTVKTVFQLLVKKPEQEKFLLNLLINKIGDPYYKLASSVAKLLTQLVESHPNMKTVVVREVEQLMFRPNLPERAQYYSICFLNQLKYRKDEPELPLKVLKICFSFFKMFVKKGEVDSKMMSALLTGVNRAFPFAQVDADFLNDQMEHLYKTVHIVNFNTSIQALMLLYQVMSSSPSVTSRYFVALYRKLSDPALKQSSKQAMFLNVLFKSMMKDTLGKRIKAFVKRLLQVCAFQQTQFICGALVLLSEVLKAKPGLLTIEHAEDEEDDEEHFVDLPAPEDDEDMKRFKSSDEDLEEEPEQMKNITKAPGAGSSWIHRLGQSKSTDRQQVYNPYHRNPEFCCAAHECLWELGPLTQHFHPTVSLFAKQILEGKSIKYDGDPLQDFTLIRFLDRFVYKNPKKADHLARVATVDHHRYKAKGIRSVAVNTEEFCNLEQNKVPVDDRFFHQYFTQVARRKKEERDSDEESISDTEFDDYLDSYERNVDDTSALLDFAGDYGRKKDLKKGKKGDASESEEDEYDDEEDDMMNLTDEEIDFSDEDFDDFAPDTDEEKEDGLNEEDVEFSEEEEDDGLKELAPAGKKKKREATVEDIVTKKRLRKSGDSSNLFAAADAFSELIEESAGTAADTIGGEAFANTDKASVKQLRWESQRDEWVRGKDWKSMKAAKGGRKARPGGKPSSSGKPKGKSTPGVQKGKSFGGVQKRGSKPAPGGKGKKKK